MKNYPILNLLMALIFLLLFFASKKIFDNYLAALIIIFGTLFCIYLGRSILYLIRHFDNQKTNRISV